MSKLKLLMSIFLISTFSIVIMAQGQMTTNAIYQDSNNERYEWKIIDSDALVWDGGAYVPFGLRVVFSCLESADITAFSQSDKDIIENIYSVGVKDIIISNGYQITQSNPDVLQEIIDFLENKGMSYGIELGEETDEPLKGFIIDPAKYRLDGPFPEQKLTRMAPAIDSGLFTVVSKTNGRITQSGVIEKNPNGQININTAGPLDSSAALLIYPHVTFYNNFDIWQGYDQMRDEILAYFKDVKLSSGFRFFYNPFNAQKLEFAKNMRYFIPNSSKFSLGFENYITKKYFTIGAIAEFWGMPEGLKEAQDYLKLVPLWAPGRGLPQFYNSKTSTFINANIDFCSYWDDMLAYRNQSVRRYMDSICEVLRKNIANVPVIFSAKEINETYSMNVSQSSSDGFIYDYSGNKDNLVNVNAGLLSTYADSYPKTTWLTTMNPNVSNQSDINNLLELGYKGFFWDYNDISDAIKVANMENGIAKSVVSEFSAKIIEYPEDSFIGITPQKLDSNTWWLPASKKATIYAFGEEIFGYMIEGTGDFVLWSTYDDCKITFPGLRDRNPVAIYPEKLNIKKLKSVGKIPMYQITIGKTPVVLRNISAGTFFPKEVAEKELANLDDMRKKYKVDDVVDKLQKVSSDKVKTAIKNGSYSNAYGMAKEAIGRFLALYGSNIWIDDRAFKRNSFTEFKPTKHASYGLTLVLDETDAPPVSEYYASTTIETAENRNYTMWVAVSNDNISSDFQISHNGNPWRSVDKDSKISYGENFSWYKVGEFSFYEGKQIIEIRVTEPNPVSGKYYLELDAVVLVQDDFVPKNDSMRPDFITIFR